MVRLSELTEEQKENWIEMMDLVILSSTEEDKKLKSGLRFLDGEAMNRKIDIYDMALALYDKVEVDKKIESWKQAKAL